MRKEKGSNPIFKILYVVGFVGTGLIGLLSNSFFAYEIFNTLWADILYLFFIALLFVTAFCHEVYLSRKREDIVLNFITFIGGLAVFLLFMLFGGVFTFCAFVFATVMSADLAIRFAVEMSNRPKKKRDVGSRRLLCILFLMVFIMAAQMRVNFVDDSYMVWALIPAGVLFVVAFAVALVFMGRVWAKQFPQKSRRVLNAVLIAFLVFFAAYLYSFVGVGVANCAFDGEPVKTECVVLEKHVNSGSRSVTRFEVKVTLGEKERWLSVPVTDYHALGEGDAIVVDYYAGALGFAYYAYYGRA